MGGKAKFQGGTCRKVGSKLEKKLWFFQGNQGQSFQFGSGRIEAPLLHILDPNYLSFYLKCPRKYQRTYNFDILPTLSRIGTSPPPKFSGGWILNLITSPCVHIIKVWLCKVFVFRTYFVQKLLKKNLRGGRLEPPPPPPLPLSSI